MKFASSIATPHLEPACPRAGGGRRTRRRSHPPLRPASSPAYITLMIAELGHFALALALFVAVIQVILPLMGAHTGNIRAMQVGSQSALAQFILVLIAFLALTNAYITSDFSLANVFQNSHTDKPLLYKIAGVWGNHEGSMLLWILMLSFLGALVALFGDNLPKTLQARVLGIQALIGVGFLAFLLLSSNPFERMDPVPLNGTDLNPLLQDPGLAYHPPFLYLGYVGMSVAFSFAVAALLEGRVDPAWARWVRPWTLLAWSSLTLGIAMGSWWAYYELGWGGYWFWDPVENASLMPWLAGTALLHSAIVVEKRDTLKVWTILMAIVAFSTSLLGTFIVRSGLLTSVHSFATDPARGVILLGICVALTGGALALFAWRASALKSGGSFQLLSRESALIANNVLLTVILFFVMLGTFWPTIAELVSGRRVSVGPPYYNFWVIPLFTILVAFMAMGIFLPWKRGKAAALWQKMRIPLAAAVVFAATVFFIVSPGQAMAFLAALIAFWIMFISLADAGDRIKLFKIPLGESLRRAKGVPRSFWGGTMAHFGLGFAILGMTGTSLWLDENIEALWPGETMEVGGYELRFDKVELKRVQNYETEMGYFTLMRNGRVVGMLTPERRWYPVAQMETVEAAILPRWANDVYVAIGEPRGEDGKGRVVRAYHHPLVLYLWGGALLMTFGGVLSLTDRRYRIGAPARNPACKKPKGETPPSIPTPPADDKEQLA